MTRPRHPRRWLPAVLAVLGALTTGACGGGAGAGNGTDRAFVGDMIPHHRSAVDMAEIARQRGEHPEIRTLAGEIIAGQSEEIEEMNRVGDALEAQGVEPGKLGVPMHMMGMDMDVATLRTAQPFDRAFIDMMIPHHQGAIRMARAELDEGASGELETLAEEIVSAQAKEIERMNEWRTRWYGAPSPAGGVPTDKG